MEKHFNKISGKNGFYDFEDKLNYFEYFGIKGEDLENVFLLFKKYENNMHALKTSVEEKIKDRYEFYINNSYNKSTKKFTKIRDAGEKIISKALFTSSIFLGARLVSQEYVLLSTINKLIYNVDLRVFKFGNEKFSYHIYKKSLKEYYETLSTFGYFIMEENEETLNIFERMDEYSEKNLYSLEAYKDIFLYLWMYTYIKFSCDLSDYKFKYDDTKRVYPKIKNNVLSPMDYDKFFDEEGFEEENLKKESTVQDLRDWSLEPYYITLENKIRDYYKELNLVGTVSLDEYFIVADEIKKIYLKNTKYNVLELSKTLFTEAGAVSEKIYTNEEIDFIIKYLTFDRKFEDYKNLKLDDFYNEVYKRPIFEFKNSNKDIVLLSFPEFIWMSYHMQKQYHFFDKTLSKTFNTKLRKDYHEIINDQLLRIEKRFKVMKALDLNDIPFFIESKMHTPENVLANTLLFDPTANRLLFVLTNFYSEENIDWLNAKRTIDTFLSDAKIAQQMFSKVFGFVSKDIKKLKKQLKKLGLEIDENVDLKIEGILFINDILNAIPKINVNGYTVHIAGISTIEYFTTSFIYKKN
ncbi:hypothetical protein [Spiroplasma sp. BIUS-1]|uniref:hypothetical protein n=1 Tax=Spiroplasma sp. BIUS-1 TaxID=216964 RepID=UPI0013980BEC|nr:hypothetical protein [Spiroplasma sp. BIUS-1]QHX36790.1 hypothetical protein SBIUS_v1c05370 [Spiroplasma sp. BIUS-1]